MQLKNDSDDEEYLLPPPLEEYRAPNSKSQLDLMSPGQIKISAVVTNKKRNEI